MSKFKIGVFSLATAAIIGVIAFSLFAFSSSTPSTAWAAEDPSMSTVVDVFDVSPSLVGTDILGDSGQLPTSAQSGLTNDGVTIHLAVIAIGAALVVTTVIFLSGVTKASRVSTTGTSPTVFGTSTARGKARKRRLASELGRVALNPK